MSKEQMNKDRKKSCIHLFLFLFLLHPFLAHLFLVLLFLELIKQIIRHPDIIIILGGRC